MSIAVWSTLSRTKEPLEPLEPRRLRVFVCGPTVYASSHLGHAKTYTQFDLIVRHLRWRGYEVTYVQNITDIDDKIIKRAGELGVSPKDLARQHEATFVEEMHALGNTSVDHYARASDFIPQIVSQVERLLSSGHVYELPDGYYFDIESFPEYGKLARRQNVAPDDSVSRIDENPLKRHPGDFAVWKRRKPNEPYWDVPLGPGRPGWHIEDTAITEELFGPQYDIHGGAVDLIFPHHEAEIALMESISERSPLARYWLHTGFLTLREQKMSKSLGNVFAVGDVLADVDARVLRFFFLSHHYRSAVEYDRELLESAGAALRRIDNFYQRLPADDGSTSPEVEETRAAMVEALDDDFDTPRAFGELFGFIRRQRRRAQPAAGARRMLEDLDEVFRVLRRQAARTDVDDAWIQAEVDRRQALRRERRFDAADEIRDRLAAMGIVVEDTADGARWHRVASAAE
jgi:cysteinyl-tRNA synthetase